MIPGQPGQSERERCKGAVQRRIGWRVQGNKTAGRGGPRIERARVVVEVSYRRRLELISGGHGFKSDPRSDSKAGPFGIRSSEGIEYQRLLLLNQDRTPKGQV